jgi:RNase P subunit RPR2
MEFGVAEMWVLVLLVGFLIVYLTHDAKRMAETQNITKICDDVDGRREYIASGITDYNHPGAKILVILYSLFCRKCDSTNIFAEIAEDKEHIQVICRDCGYNTLIPLKKMLIHESLTEEDYDKAEEEVVREYIHKIHEKHEVDVVDPEKSHKQ